MLLQVICTLSLGLTVFVALIGISVVVIGGKSDEELGYKLPMNDLSHDSEYEEREPVISGGLLYEPGKSE